MKKTLTEDNLFQLLNSYRPMPEELCKDIRSLLKYQEFKKGQFLLKAGTVCNRIYFILDGQVYCFYGDKSAPEIEYFMTEGEMPTSKDSFFGREPSIHTIEALEPVKTLYLTYDDLEWLYEKHEIFNFTTRKVTEYYHVRGALKSRIRSLKNPVDRYNLMKCKRPDLIGRVPNKLLAVFMGMARETLSRIKSQESSTE